MHLTGTYAFDRYAAVGVRMHLTTALDSETTAEVFECTHGSFPIRHQRGHPGVVLPLVVFKFGKSLGRNAIRMEPN